MNILITVCGRAGSKGVKNKNLRSFLEIPLLSYTFSAAELFKARNVKKFGNIDIAVNSDSDELLNLMKGSAEYYKIKRPEELAQDASAKVPVIRHSLNYMEDLTHNTYDYIIDLDITSPLRSVNDIEMALEKSLHNTYDVVFSVVESRRNPYFNMVEESNNGVIKVKDSHFTARQQAPSVYDLNASIYVYKRESLLNVLKDSPLDGISGVHVMKDTGILDIDSEEDLIMMEVVAKYLFENYSEFNEIYTKAQALSQSIKDN